MPPTLRLVVLALLVLGCAPIPTASMTNWGESRTFVPSEGKSRIYVYRADGFTGSMARLKVAVDSQIVGKVEPNTYVMVELDPGPHLVGGPTAENESFVGISALPDSCYFVKIWPKMGFMSAHSGLGLMEADSARRLILTARMVETAWPGKPMSKE